MLVMTAMVGVSRRNDPSLSSASATNKSPAPSRAFEPSAAILPPTTTVGSTPAARSTVATSEVVVVLPCDPAMATPYFTRISSASISARAMTGMPRALGLDDLGIGLGDGAREHDDVCPVHVFGTVPDVERARPAPTRRRVMSFSLRSEPDTSNSMRAQDLGEPAHADAADADEMDVTNATSKHGAPPTRRPHDRRPNDDVECWRARGDRPPRLGPHRHRRAARRRAPSALVAPSLAQA